MVAMERGIVKQRAVALLLSLLCFMSLLNKRLGGPGNTKVRVFVAALTFLIATDKMLINTLLQALPPIRLWYCFQEIKSSLSLDAILNHFIMQI